MIPTYAALEPTYAHELDVLKISDGEEHLILGRVQKIMAYADTYYRPLFEETGVPIPVLAAINERESSTNFTTYFGNGDPLNRKTTHVPRNRGPFPPPHAWDAGAVDALHLDGLDQYQGQWTLELACYLTNRYNGFGPNAHGLPSGYVFAGSSIYTGGKYIADGVWSATAKDTQLGCIPMILAIGHLYPDMALPRATVSAKPIGQTPAPAVMASADEVRLLQVFLNKLQPADDLVLDGNYGRKTRYAVQAFEQSHGFYESIGIATAPMVKTLVKEAALQPGAWAEPNMELAQALLNEFGAHPPLVVDGVNGFNTKGQLAAFQDANSLEMTGTVTGETIEAMQDKLRRGV